MPVDTQIEFFTTFNNLKESVAKIETDLADVDNGMSLKEYISLNDESSDDINSYIIDRLDTTEAHLEAVTKDLLGAYELIDEIATSALTLTMNQTEGNKLIDEIALSALTLTTNQINNSKYMLINNVSNFIFNVILVILFWREVF